MAFRQEDASLLLKHLQALIEVELFTIPLYLTAANSLRSDLPENDPAFKLQGLATSVAVQEMYHLQLACNIANAFDVTPVFPKLTLNAGEKILVPHLDPGDQPFYAQLGNLPDTITAMLEIETPDNSGQTVTPNPDVTYHSIADLYSATLQLLSAYWATFKDVPASLDPHFTPGHNQIGFGAFPLRFKYNQIEQRTDVMNSINAITDQGEGNSVAPANSAYRFQYGTNDKVSEAYQGSKSDRFYEQDLYTHYYRFQQIKDNLGTDPQAAYYQSNGDVDPNKPDWVPPLDRVQNAINVIWSFLLDTMEQGFASGNLPQNNPTQPNLPGFGSAMVSFKYIIPMAWQWGACPSFVYLENITAQDVQDAMDEIDPWCLYHWDATTAQLRIDHADQLNACQGLNQCKGLGWGAIATQRGDGACATADTHTCVGSNSCARQGGCGYFSEDDKQHLLDESEQWVPGQNVKAGWGGCQTPISTGQKFFNYGTSSSDPFPDLNAKYAGTSVWDRARDLFGNGQSLPAPVTKQVGKWNYDGTTRRSYITPSSK